MEARTTFDVNEFLGDLFAMAPSAFGLGSTAITAQSNQAIAQTYANAGILPGVQSTQPVIMMGGGNAPQTQQAQRSGTNTWVIVGVVVAVVAVVGYFLWSGKK